MNNWSNNVSFTINSDKWSSQNIEKSIMTRILSTKESTEFEKSTEFAKILNWTAQSINKSIKWLADTGMICHIMNLSDYFVNLTFCSCHINVVNDESMLDILIDNIQLTLSLSDDTEK